MHPTTTTFTAVALAAIVLGGGGDARAEAPAETLTLLVVGDVGLNRNKLPVDERGVLEGRGVLAWSDMTGEIADLINGDLNFMNLETVVTDRNDLVGEQKGQKNPFLFRSHPTGVAHLAEIGFNLASAANNHAYDYGAEGVLETLRHLEALAESAAERGDSFWYAGVGANREEASRPRTFRFRGARVAFSAIGIVTNMIRAHRAGDDKPGTLGYRFEEDWKLATDRLAEAEADLRLLSIHYGREGEIQVDDKQRREWRFAVRERGVDVVIGHHAHVVRGIELYRGKVIFYGLGNFLIRGARDMGAVPANRVSRDYGIIGKVHLRRDKAGGYAVRAVQVLPVVDMHRIAKRWPLEQAKLRIEVLNVLAEDLDDPEAGAVGLRFQIRDSGTGLWCADGADRDRGRVGRLCRTHEPPPAPSAEARAAVSRAARGK